MSSAISSAPEYVAARRVLIDALVALRPHLDAMIVIGAQAVYLRTVDRIPHYQPFTPILHARSLSRWITVGVGPADLGGTVSNGPVGPGVLRLTRRMEGGSAGIMPSIWAWGGWCVGKHEGSGFTTDADLVVDPGLLGETPLLGDVMLAAGFTSTNEPGIWVRRIKHPDFHDGIAVPVDLIVPARIAPKAGRRGARLPGGHGNRAARKTPGVEGALVDHSPCLVPALDPGDGRGLVVNVAGAAALVVAKAHKLGERLATPSRLVAKDAGDLYRLFEATAMTEMAATTRRLLADERSAATTMQALDYLIRLFGTPRSPGVELAAGALADVADPATVSGLVVGYTRDLDNAVRNG